MTYVSINRAAVTPESAAEFERIAERWLRGERERLPREELLSRQLVRADDRAEYAVISVWASQEAKACNEDYTAQPGALQLNTDLHDSAPVLAAATTVRED